MADLPDYYTQAQISEAEAASFKGGLLANRSLTPVSRDIYLATDTLQLFYCVADGFWVDVTHACLLLAGGIMTGAIDMGANQINNMADPALAQDAATMAYVLARAALYLPLAGGTMTGAIDMGANQINNMADPAVAQDAATRAYVLARAALYLPLAGGTMAGNIIMGGNKLTGLGAGVAAGESVRYEQLPVPTKEFFVPVLTGTDLEYLGARVDGPADEGDLALLVPQDFTALTALEVIFHPMETGASMNFVIATYYGAYNGGESYQVHFETEDPRDIGATVTGENLAHSISDLVDLGPLAAGDLLFVRVVYDAAVIDSNSRVAGLRLKYT
ncbi:hypothetical protein ES708_21879 [subsurface metagenome]